MSFISKFEKYSFPKIGLVRLPEIAISKEDKASVGLKPNASNKDYLKKICWNGYLEKEKAGLLKDFSKELIVSQLKNEFEVFEKTGIIDYLLLVWDILKWCDKQNIARGLGRGSAAGSLSLYFLGITNINPLRHKLSFTRFLSEARAKPQIIDDIIYADGKNLCDIDSDISFVDRPRVIKYIEEKHAGKTCKISTRLQFTGKTALKDVLKIYGNYDEGSAKHVTDWIEAHYGKVDDLHKYYEKQSEFKNWVDSLPKNKKIYELARKLEGLNLGKGQHPSGVFISYYPLDGNVPVELSKTKDVVTSYDMNIAATLAVKVDVLGLRSVDIIQKTCNLIGKRVEDIDVNHPSIYEYFKNSNLYYGLFQIEEGLTKEVIHKVKPRNIEELCACLAISRPGSLKFIDDYVKYVHTGEYNKVYDSIDNILQATGGILLYQEQVNRICQEVFGMTAVAADEARRAIGKKKKDEMAKLEPTLYELGRAKNIPDSVIKWFWDICNSSADYLFNQSHSASYSYLTAYTTFLKANYSKEFIYTLLQLSKFEPNSQEVLSAVISEAQQLGIKILSPDISKSKEDFSIEDDGIRFGLSHIKGISDATMSKLTSFRRNFNNKFEIFEAAQEAKISISVLTGLIYCGAIDPKGIKRSRLALEAQSYNLLTEREKLLVHRLSKEYGEDLLAMLLSLKNKKDENGKVYIRDNRFETFKKNYEPYKKMYLENSKSEKLCSYIMEKHYLGFSYSHDLHSIFAEKIHDLMQIKKVATEKKGKKVKFVGFIEDVKKYNSRKTNEPYYKYYIYDESGQTKIMLYGSEKISSCEQFNNGNLPKIGDIIIVHGTVADETMIFAESIVVQDNPIRFKKGTNEIIVE